ncbi:Hpt domain-containing protein [Vibrio alfacsensis]|uniref:Hpt domain-containing protein n=1 Tax=Vibrio alfacsensis TaxID=1074311 RepID=UPI002ADD480F|nr:Hpt domain-containing protein [Vibrio alfacsensis]WQE77037.1 Hpt domain-containing protein [Vibrio alfacsensis]
MRQRKIGRYGVVWLLIALWLALTSGAWFQAQQTMQTILTVKELGSKVDEVRNIFQFELPYRAQHIDQASLKLQLVSAVRLQLESQSDGPSKNPDLTQLFYNTDRFLEEARVFIASDSTLMDLSDQLYKSRESNANSAQLKSMYYRLGALVFESMFSESATSADTYRQLDSLFTESQTLPKHEQSIFLRRLAQTSNVLAAHAQGGHLANKLLTPELPNQLASISAELEKKLVAYLGFVILLSGSVIALITWFFLNERTKAMRPASDNRPASDSKDSTINAGENCLPHEPQYLGKEKEKEKEKTELSPVTAFERSTIVNSPPVLDIEKMLDSMSGDEDAIRTLLEVFIKEHKDDAEKFRVQLKSEKQSAQRIVHSLKGVSGSLGAMPLYGIARDIEYVLKSGEQVSEDLINQLSHTLEQSITFAQQVLNNENC